VIEASVTKQKTNKNKTAGNDWLREEQKKKKIIIIKSEIRKKRKNTGKQKG
jgi:hypothetical protein